MINTFSMPLSIFSLSPFRQSIRWSATPQVGFFNEGVEMITQMFKLAHLPGRALLFYVMASVVFCKNRV